MPTIVISPKDKIASGGSNNGNATATGIGIGIGNQTWNWTETKAENGEVTTILLDGSDTSIHELAGTNITETGTGGVALTSTTDDGENNNIVTTSGAPTNMELEYEPYIFNIPPSNICLMTDDSSTTSFLSQ